MEKLSWTLHLEGREDRYRQKRHEEWKTADFYFILFTFGVTAAVLVGPANLVADDPRPAFAIATLSLFTAQIGALLLTPEWYLRHRAAITVVVRLYRIASSAFVMTGDLMAALTSNPRWPELIPGFELKAISLSFGVFYCWLSAFGCPLPFTLALPLQLLNTFVHASLWFKHGVSALARSKLLPYLVKLTRHTADLVTTILYPFDPTTVTLHRAASDTYSPECVVLPLAVTIMTMLCCITPMYIVYCTEARLKLAYVKQQSSTTSSGQGRATTASICVSPAVRWVAAVGVEPLLLRVAWGVVLLASVASLVQLTSSYVVEMLLVPYFGIAGSNEWCPQPEALAAATPGSCAVATS